MTTLTPAGSQVPREFLPDARESPGDARVLAVRAAKILHSIPV
jgi:hypothetical protein